MSSTASTPSKRKTVKSATATQSETLTLSTALDGFSKASDALLKRFEELTTTREDILQNGDREIADLKRRREEEADLYENTKRARRVEVEQDLKEYGREAARRLLAECQMEAVNSEEYEALRAERDRLRQSHEAEISSAVEAARKALNTAHEHARRTQELENAATVAELTAEVKQLKSTIADLRKALDHSEENLERQRQLTQSVAEACKAPPIMQNLGK